MKSILNSAILAATTCLFAAPPKEKKEAAGGAGGPGGAGSGNDAFKAALSDEESRKTYVAPNDDDWDNAEGQEFGGASGLLALNIGESTVDIVYTGFNPTDLSGDGKLVNVHTGNAGDPPSPVRLPIAASFGRAMDQAKVQIGDTIRIKRFEDATKKAGKGKGNAMQIYAVKVTARVAEDKE